MKKLNDKFDNFNQAVKRLNEANIAYKKNTVSDLFQDALIKRFEFTFELAWKTLRQYLIDEGYRLESVSPKGVLSFAYQERILNDEELWLDMLECRNTTTHDYGRELATVCADKISNRFCKALSDLNRFIFDRLKKG